MTEREKLIGRVRALQAKTVANGCTEDEAIAAAAKVAELLERYNLGLDEIELRKSPFERQTDLYGDSVGERLWKVSSAIAHLTETRSWVSGTGVHPVQITFFGFAHEVEIARYLLDLCAGAMRREQAALERSLAILAPAVRRRRVLPYLDGMADRLAQRIRALKPPRPTGTGLVVLRKELVERAMADAGLKIGTRQMRPSWDHEATYQAGRRAADRVALNPGVASGGQVRGRLR